ncbi:MAG: hypothetical protein U5N10_16985 [Gemmobacter sp.]|nr:hypothetical protein [Gemmobacter sp.]
MDNKHKIILEALRQTELWLEDQQAVVTACEQRAFQFSAACVLIATFGVSFASDLPNPFAMYLGAAGLVISAIWSLYSALPRHFYNRGHLWENWCGHVHDNDSIWEVLVSQAEENDVRINYNIKSLEESAVHFKVSFMFSLVSISVFALGQLFASLADLSKESPIYWPIHM